MALESFKKSFMGRKAPGAAGGAPGAAGAAAGLAGDPELVAGGAIGVCACTPTHVHRLKQAAVNVANLKKLVMQSSFSWAVKSIETF